MINLEERKKYFCDFLDEETVLKFNTHRWIEHDSTMHWDGTIIKCSQCGTKEFEWLVKYYYLTCNEICIKQIIE